MSPEDKEFLDSLLKEIEPLLMDNIVPHDYASLKAQIVNQELMDELEALRELLAHKTDQFEDAFKTRCKERAKRNENTCLSFFALPLGSCNTLYWQIAERLFKPKTLGEMFELLLSDSASLISPEFYLDLPPNSTSEQLIAASKHASIELCAKPFAELTEASDMKRLTQFIMAENWLFDINELAEFNFVHHQALLKTLQNKKSTLIEKLYQHNPSLQTLYTQLLTVNNQGQSLYEAIKHLIQELTLGGERFTGDVYASTKAQVAYTDFLSHLNSFPSPIKASFMALKTSYNLTLNEILDDLNQEDCVETGASRLREILDNPVNLSVLNTKPNLSQEEIDAIKNQYEKNSLPLTGNDSTNNLPANYLCTQLSRLEIIDEFNYLDLLIAFPPSYYDSLLKFAQIKCKPTFPIKLLEMLKTGILSKEQLDALVEAIKNNVNKVGIIPALSYAVELKNYDLLKSLLAISEPQQLTDFHLLSKEDTPLLWNIYQDEKACGIILSVWKSAEKSLNTFRARCLLEEEIDYPSDVTRRLETVPENERFEIVSIKNARGDNLAQSACYRTASLLTILELLPENKRISVILDKNNAGDTLLHRVDTGILKGLLKLLPEKDRLEAINSKDNKNSAVIERLKLQQVTDLLDIFPEESRLEVFTYKNDNLFNVANNSDDLLKILSLLPENARLSLLRRECEDFTVFYWFISKIRYVSYIHNPNLFADFLLSFSENNRLEIIQMKDSEGTPFFNPDGWSLASLIATFNLFPKKDRLSIMLQENKMGKNFLQSLATAESLVLLKLLPEEDRFAALKCRPPNGSSLLEKSAGLVMLKPALEVLPKEERLSAILELFEKTQKKKIYELMGPTQFIDLLEALPKDDWFDTIGYIHQHNNFYLHHLVYLLIQKIDTATEVNLIHIEALQTVLVVLSEIPLVRIKNMQLASLVEFHRQIKQLKHHGSTLQEGKESESLDYLEGQKAIKLAEKFEGLAIQFIVAKNSDSNAQLQTIREEFKIALESGYQEMHTHRSLWKPILANIAIAATGIGLLVIIAKYLTTGSAFFAETQRQKMVHSISHQLDCLAP
ncbi:hypothetical protein A8135_10725 [Legionella jamestowniensis]|uniref:Ankyrin repeat protein n=1 Tax=Legionella jamestowniensis TaxID=455 RepID=A0ABX2XVV9_9GAMM|nr:hypothetical protein [Legionella jamestowniensis]OCH98768.1 hypothetical protein A8135_10725 [Legionella jamestowniensis]